MLFLLRYFPARSLSLVGTLCALVGVASSLFLVPQSAASEPLSSQIEQARSLAATSPREGLDLAKQAADAAEQTGDVIGEVQARGLIVSILRNSGNALDVTLYREQLNETIILAPLEEEAVTSVLTYILGGGVTPELGKAVFEITEGNPFFVEEMARTLLKTGQVEDHQGQWRLSPGADYPPCEGSFPPRAPAANPRCSPATGAR